MTLHSAWEDLQHTTLKAIVGSLRKLEYLSQLRDGQGGYSHWGLSRVHGEERAKSALQESHRLELSRVVRTPIRSLEYDAEESSREAGVPEAEYLARLSAGCPRLLPAEPGAGSSRHFSSVLLALSSLLRARKPDANRPV
jgi:hypothetical protein